MKNARYEFKFVKTDDGQEKWVDAKLYPCSPRKLVKWMADHPMYKTVVKPDDKGNMTEIREYTSDKEKEGFGWAEDNRDAFKQFLEEEKCDCPLDNGVTLDEELDVIMATDNSFARFYYGSEKKGIEGFLEKCYVASVKFS